MSRTRRSKTSEVLRHSQPYKRPKHAEILREFEIQYVAVNKDPTIQL